MRGSNNSAVLQC